MARTVELDLLAKDRTSPAFRSASRNATRSESTFRKVGKTLATVGKIAGVGLAAGVGLGAVAVESFVAEGREANKVGALTKAVLKSTGGAAKVTAKQVEDLATSISEKSGIDDEAIQTGENLLLTFKGIRNEAGKGNKIFDQTTQIMVDMGVALGTDASGAAIKLGKALNDPVKGISALTRVGVTFTQAQKDSIAAMVKAGDTMGAQKIILKELKSEFGGAAAAVATPWDKLKVKLQNIEEEIGKKLIPKLDALATWISDKGIPALQSFATWFSEHVTPKIRALRNYMVNTLFPALRKMVEDVLPDVMISLDLFAGQILKVYDAWVTLVGGEKDASSQTHRTTSAMGKAIKGLLFVVRAPIQIIGDLLANLLRILNGIKVGIQWIASHVAAAFRAVASELGKIKWPHIPDFSAIHLPSLPHIPGLAAGGPVMAGHPYIVGEHRPELFVPSQNGRIEPRVNSSAAPIVVQVMLDRKVLATAVASELYTGHRRGHQ